MKRISYGKERVRKYWSPRCPHCAVRPGIFHEFGCVLEECPKCGDKVHSCSCMVLSQEEERRMIKALKKYMDHNIAFSTEDNSESPDMNDSYFEKSAKLWIAENYPQVNENE